MHKYKKKRKTWNESLGVEEANERRLKLVELNKTIKRVPMKEETRKIFSTYAINHLKNKTWEDVMGKERAEERKKKISIKMKNRDAHWMKGNKNPMKNPEIAKRAGDSEKGKQSPFKGKTYEEIYGIDKAKKLKESKIPPPTLDVEFYLKNGYQKQYEPYTDEFNKEFKKIIAERDNFTCQLCNELLPDNFAVHHIDYNKKNSSPKNLIFLCSYCHGKTGHNRDFWKSHFQLHQIIHHHTGIGDY
jgi:hypothetical protein